MTGCDSSPCLLYLVQQKGSMQWTVLHLSVRVTRDAHWQINLGGKRTTHMEGHQGQDQVSCLRYITRFLQKYCCKGATTLFSTILSYPLFHMVSGPPSDWKPVFKSRKGAKSGSGWLVRAERRLPGQKFSVSDVWDKARFLLFPPETLHDPCI